MAKGVITEVGRIKLCKAHAEGAPLPKLTQMGFGDGGLNEAGEDVETTGFETALKHELFRENIGEVSYPVETTGRFSRRVEKNELVKAKISEIGIYDADGDLIAYKTCLPKQKDDDMVFIFHMDEVF